ncbi:DUF4352 domain-containing protein [Crossiella sp. SN42]|uniref:DUF4352 domain-containing protein n=1 Tax=Crossiella sp. SN42 TaxID=2944808 RepID=UPI00207C4C4C|nr:DUF4352 domain-containing protein [Crossiella sp. SN42]MCO1577922.1 DUF4352 domain-containing protein [Crossiella sp. SN42]
MTYQLPVMPEAPPPPPRPRFSGLALTALILGLVGLFGSPIIILNNVTAIAAGVGVVLGVIALFGARKVMAAIGVGLCVLGIVITVVVQAAAVKALDEALRGTTNQGQVSEGEPAQAKPADNPPPAETPTWGKRYTWPDGLAVEVAKPVACKPGKYASPSTVERAVKVSVTVVNGTREPVQTGLLLGLTDAQFDGREARSVTDFNGPCGTGLDSGTVLPGKSFTYEVAYAVGAKPGELQLAFQPGFGKDKAVFVGQA